MPRPPRNGTNGKNDAKDDEDGEDDEDVEGVEFKGAGKFLNGMYWTPELDVQMGDDKGDVEVVILPRPSLKLGTKDLVSKQAKQLPAFDMNCHYRMNSAAADADALEGVGVVDVGSGWGHVVCTVAADEDPHAALDNLLENGKLVVMFTVSLLECLIPVMYTRAPETVWASLAIGLAPVGALHHPSSCQQLRRWCGPADRHLMSSAVRHLGNNSGH